ncbi:MAG: hypothetical protein WC595_05180 [Candidatus Nanoarchaeia archaeon]
MHVFAAPQLEAKVREKEDKLIEIVESVLERVSENDGGYYLVEGENQDWLGSVPALYQRGHFFEVRGKRWGQFSSPPVLTLIYQTPYNYFSREDDGSDALRGLHDVPAGRLDVKVHLPIYDWRIRTLLRGLMEQREAVVDLAKNCFLYPISLVSVYQRLRWERFHGKQKQGRLSLVNSSREGDVSLADSGLIKIVREE